MSLSATEPISRALERTKAMLFQSPVTSSKWFVMGFAYFLASLGEGGGGGNFRSPGNFGGSGPGSSGGTDPFEPVIRWIHENWELVIWGGTAAALLVLGLGFVLMWVASRGKFVFLDNVVKDRAAISEPWRQYAPQGNGLFWLKVKLSLAGLGLLALAVGGGIALAWADIQARSFGTGAVVGIAFAALLTLPSLVVLSVVSWLLNDFAVPVMYLRGTPAGAAFGSVWRDLLRAHLGPVAAYLGLKMVMTLVANVIMVVVGVCTCCILALPYLSSVAFLPVGVFFRNYCLYFIEQLGPDWQLIVARPEEPWRSHGEYRRW